MGSIKLYGCHPDKGPVANEMFHNNRALKIWGMRARSTSIHLMYGSCVSHFLVSVGGNSTMKKSDVCV